MGSGEVTEQCYGECTTATTHDCRYVVYPELFANEEPVALATGVSAQYTSGDMNMPSVLLFSFTDSFDVNTVSIQAPGALYPTVLYLFLLQAHRTSLCSATTCPARQCDLLPMFQAALLHQ